MLAIIVLSKVNEIYFMRSLINFCSLFESEAYIALSQSLQTYIYQVKLKSQAASLSPKHSSVSSSQAYWSESHATQCVIYSCYGMELVLI